MFVSDRIILLELQKSGTTHLRYLLKKIPDLNGRIVGKHNALYEVKPGQLGDVRNKKIIATIRNPWDWYVSVWAFGCMKKGGVWAWTTREFSWTKKFFYPLLYNPIGKTIQLMHAKDWQATYENVLSPDCFKQWLSMIYSGKYAGDVGEGYARSALFPWAGFMTHRYARLYWKDKKGLGQAQNIRELRAIDRRKNAVDAYVRTEHLYEDLCSALYFLDTGQGINRYIEEHGERKRNRSDRREYPFYYDTESRSWVEEKERFIIEKHGYTFE